MFVAHLKVRSIIDSFLHCSKRHNAAGVQHPLCIFGRLFRFSCNAHFVHRTITSVVLWATARCHRHHGTIQPFTGCAISVCLCV